MFIFMVSISGSMMTFFFFFFLIIFLLLFSIVDTIRGSLVAGKNEGHEKRMNILGPVFSLFVGLFVLFFLRFCWNMWLS